MSGPLGSPGTRKFLCPGRRTGVCFKSPLGGLRMPVLRTEALEDVCAFLDLLFGLCLLSCVLRSASRLRLQGW